MLQQRRNAARLSLAALLVAGLCALPLLPRPAALRSLSWASHEARITPMPLCISSRAHPLNAGSARGGAVRRFCLWRARDGV